MVNGTRADIHSANKTSITVRLKDGRLADIPQVKFGVYSPMKRGNVASRTQFPIKPAFAMTIHKSQGMYN